MDQHPIPRQITSFEFKLIGFMTLKQFLYLVVFFPIGYIVYAVNPIPIINVVLGVLVGVVGLIFAFVPFQDRPIEEWIRNLIKRMNSPTQYSYKKEEEPVYFLKNLYFANDPHIVLAHVDSKEKLNAYLSQKKSDAKEEDMKQKKHIKDLLKQQESATHQKKSHVTGTVVGHPQQATTMVDQLNQMRDVVHQPFITGVVKNRKQIALPGILVSIKDRDGKQLRLLKTNPHGIFATYSPLAAGTYVFELSDPNQSYFFDTMNVQIVADHQPSLMFYSKEIM